MSSASSMLCEVRCGCKLVKLLILKIFGNQFLIAIKKLIVINDLTAINAQPYKLLWPLVIYNIKLYSHFLSEHQLHAEQSQGTVKQCIISKNVYTDLINSKINK